MAGTDPAFLWETEVLRQTRSRGRSQVTRRVRGDQMWVTVREAAEATGIPDSTIRKWVRHHGLPSFLEETSGSGHVRMVSLDAVRQRAADLGREVPSAQPGGAVPEGTMLVPLDAWERMLRQLGNLHEAGQQLAEARERAARAETEARFLRERLAELRQEMERARAPGDEPATASPPSLARRVYRAWRRSRRSNH